MCSCGDIHPTLFPLLPRVQNLKLQKRKKTTNYGVDFQHIKRQGNVSAGLRAGDQNELSGNLGGQEGGESSAGDEEPAGTTQGRVAHACGWNVPRRASSAHRAAVCKSKQQRVSRDHMTVESPHWEEMPHQVFNGQEDTWRQEDIPRSQNSSIHEGQGHTLTRGLQMQKPGYLDEGRADAYGMTFPSTILPSDPHSKVEF